MKTFALIALLGLVGMTEGARDRLFLDRMDNTNALVAQQTAENPKMMPAKPNTQVAAQKTMTENADGLKDAMHAMMDDDDEDDIAGSNANTAFLQSEQGEDAYMEDSAESLSAALGPRWNSKTLEKTADENTKALLQGIASPKALNGLNNMMNAMSQLR